MNVLLIDIDSRIPNLALKKLDIFHRSHGHNVQWNMPLMADWADKIYVSCIFDWNKDQCQEWVNRDNAWIGGTGYSKTITLPDAVERIRPRINLGFATRGCIRSCDFCVVPEKEGGIRAVGDLLDLWDGHSKLVTFLDNNILALPDHFRLVCKQAQFHGLRVDFNQGMDHRLLTDGIADLMKATRHKGEWRFAFDHPDMIDGVRQAIKVLRRRGINRAFWYVLVGFNTTPEEDLFRLDYLRLEKQTAYVQRYNKCEYGLRLAQWANQHNMFRAMTYEEFLAIHDDRISVEHSQLKLDLGVRT